MAGFASYIKESYSELTERVSWPTWMELQSSAIVVFIATLIISLIIFVMDYVFGVSSSAPVAGEFVWRGILGYIYDLLN